MPNNIVFNMEEAYRALQTQCGIRRGDRVKVLKKARSGEKGWHNSWNGLMNAAIGNTYTVLEVSSSGIRLNSPGRDIGYWFPFFVLELVE